MSAIEFQRVKDTSGGRYSTLVCSACGQGSGKWRMYGLGRPQVDKLGREDRFCDSCKRAMVRTYESALDALRLAA